MRELANIIEIIETKSEELYGSTNKMLKENNINSSIVGNMKRKKPSIPNIFDFCKLAEALNLSLDYLLLDKTNNQNITHFDTNMPTTFENNFNNQISVDEHNLIEIYREIDSIGKNQIQNNLRETWLEHKAMKKDASSGLISENKIG